MLKKIINYFERMTQTSSKSKLIVPSTTSSLIPAACVSKLIDLPLEVLLIIVSFVPVEFVISLCLTCKSLHKTLNFQSGKYVLLNFEHRRNLIRLLERDLPSYLYCSVCSKLYRWNRDPFCTLCPGRPWKNHPRPVRLGNSDALPLMYPETRDLILRHYVRGPGWGLPISQLQKKYHSHHEIWKFHGLNDLHLSKEVDARVVGGRLIVKQVESFNVDHERDVYNQMAVFDAFSSHQAHASQCLPWIGLIALGQLYSKTKNGAPGELPSSASTDLYNCEHCATDLKMTTERSIHNFHQVRISVTYYHDFGNPDDKPSSNQARMFQDSYTISLRYTEQRDLEHVWKFACQDGVFANEYTSAPYRSFRSIQDYSSFDHNQLRTFYKTELGSMPQRIFSFHT